MSDVVGRDPGSLGFLRTLNKRLKNYGLTPREEEIVRLLCSGMSNKEIAERCGITEQTVKDHLKHVYDKVGTRQRTALIARLIGLSA